jgi:hypothetical protein
MPTLPVDDEDRQAYEERRRFLRRFIEAQPRLDEIDQSAFSDQSHDLELLDTRQQLTDLELALGDTDAAFQQLRDIYDAASPDGYAPLHKLTAAVALGQDDIPFELWQAAEGTVHTEAQVELLCGLGLVVGGRFDGFAAESPTVFHGAAERARVPRLKALLDPENATLDDQMLAWITFLAMHGDYAARLKSQRTARARWATPTPWALIDWPLLLVHIAVDRLDWLHAAERSPLYSPENLPERVSPLFHFLASAATELRPVAATR